MSREGQQVWSKVIKEINEGISPDKPADADVVHTCATGMAVAK